MIGGWGGGGYDMEDVVRLWLLGSREGGSGVKVDVNVQLSPHISLTS